MNVLRWVGLLAFIAAMLSILMSIMHSFDHNSLQSIASGIRAVFWWLVYVYYGNRI